MGATALADALSVAVDIAPVHSLVARVMDGVGTPDLVIPAGALPHEHTLHPSEAAALEDAEANTAVVGPGMGHVTSRNRSHPDLAPSISAAW